MTSMGFIVTSALMAATLVVAAQSKVLFLTHAHGVANLSISLSLRVPDGPIHGRSPQYNGNVMCKLGGTAGHERNLILIVARYPIDLHTHDHISYWPSLIIEGLVDGYTPFMQNP